MKGVITVLGKDRVGIIAGICKVLAEDNVNILDISQTITHGFFNMMMVVDLTESRTPFQQLTGRLEQAGQELGVDVRLQREEIFDIMHRV